MSQPPAAAPPQGNGETASHEAQPGFFRRLIDAAPVAIFYKDAQGRYLGCNKAFEDFCGLKQRDLVGRTVLDIWPRDLAETYRAADEALLLGPGAQVYETTIVRPDGSRHDVALHRAILSDDAGIQGIVGVVTDIAPLKAAERTRLDHLRFVEQLIDTIPSPVFYKDTEGRHLGCNRAFARFVGMTPDDLTGKTAHDVWPKDLADTYHAADVAMFAKPGTQLYDSLLPHVDGSRHQVVFHRAPFFKADGTLAGVIAIAWDVTERERAGHALVEVLRAQALRDPLTGLFNRRYLDEVLTRELARAARMATSVGVIMADLDHFKRVNDGFGHACGDEVLRVVAEVLTDSVRKSDIVCRYGGEEFTIVMPGAPLAIAIARAEQIGAAMRSRSIMCEGRTVSPVTISLGVAHFPASGGTPQAVVAAADAALLRAKAEGRDRVVAA